MKKTLVLGIFISSFTIPLLSAPFSSAEVQVFLKNGRDVIADSCRDSGTMIICEKMGGTFEVDKKDVLKVEGITIERAPSQQGSEEKAGGEAESGEKRPAKPQTDMKAAEKLPEGELIKGLKPEEEERLDQINRKKLEMKDEKEKLIKEQDKLHEDVKITGMVKTQAQLDAIKNRIKDLETRINAFNSEVKKLNEEEKNIIEGSKNK
jgi:predicted RNase H-like nuclease (RuvC/YqgF family)